MKAKSSKQFSGIILLSIILVIAWVVLMVMTNRDIGADWDSLDFILWIRDPGIIAMLSYLNASLITIITVILFGGLYSYFRRRINALLLWAGILFVPIYGALNLVVYSTQVLFLPQLVQAKAEQLTNPNITDQLAQWVQMYPGSIMGYLNALAYAILGIASLAYGIAFLKSRASAKMCGVFLIANAFSCWIGLVGVAANNPGLSYGTVLGGLFYLIALVFMYSYFVTRGRSKHDLPKD